MKFGTVVYTHDVEAMLDFFGRALGLSTRFFDSTLGYGELDIDGALLAVASHGMGAMLMPGAYRAPDPGAQHAPVEIAFLVEDVEAMFARATRAGAEVVASPKVMPWGATVAYVRGTDGVLIGLSTPVAQPGEGGAA